MKLIPNFNSEGRGPAGIVPRICAVTGRGSDKVGFIRTGHVLPGVDQEVYISVAAAKEMGRLTGMHTQEDVEELQASVEALGEDLADAIERLDDLTQLNDLTQKVTA